ncbi:hypothetical protein RO3G_11991 [Lichtheimia corymbifera JMRC:FSU:9682]|uniref:Xylanolytic transcriptional activator regulatory domain-containing protein n=1 Tax=Lichtheimia corymbifera JMRC:FSU:9682 TaxID=1263082 RepID=A0A068S896_9FUNG|nr:hypothetical protein RO3G_11991 [Lichtheimia corymbifera JMRC:FSU:9682]
MTNQPSPSNTDDLHSTSKLKCDFIHPTCGRCQTGKATCSYTGAPTQVDLFNLVQLHDTMKQLQDRITSIENGVQQVQDDTQFIASEMRSAKKRKRNEQSDHPLLSSSSSELIPGVKANWTLSLTPEGLRIDTNIISLNDLYDILLSGLSQLQLSNTRRPATVHVEGDKAATTTHSSSNNEKGNRLKRSSSVPSAEDAVIVKQNPLYKSKDIIFPLYSAWESNTTSDRGNKNNNGPMVSTDTSKQSTPINPELLDQLLKIYQECFLCLPLPDMETFIQQCKTQTGCPLLFNAILAWSARHAAIYHGTFSGQDPNRVGEHYFIAAKDLLKDQFLTPRLTTVHALLLMYIYSIGKTGPDRDESEAYTFLGLATRMCIDLGLHREPSPCDKNNNPSLNETRRRLFAAAEFLETLYAAHSDKPLMFPLDDAISVNAPRVMEHEQGEQRYRTEFTVHRHKINQIYRRIHTSISGHADPYLATVSDLEKQLKEWYHNLPDYFKLQQPLATRDWATTSFREQACLKLNFEYHFQMCQLYSIFLPNHPDDDTTTCSTSAIALLSLKLCVDGADAITDLLECWAQLRQPWCHFTLDTLVMACLVYGHQLLSTKEAVLAHAKQQMSRIAHVLKRSPVKHHKYVKALLARIDQQIHGEKPEGGCGVPSPEQQPIQPTTLWSSHNTQQEPDSTAGTDDAVPTSLTTPAAASSHDFSHHQQEDWSWLKPVDWAHADLDLFRFADFVYTPAMDNTEPSNRYFHSPIMDWPM